MSAALDVISALPELLPDSQHGATALHLRTMLEEPRPATATILDRLTNLTLTSDTTAQVRR